MSRAASFYSSAAVTWLITFFQARQESTTVSDLVAVGSLIATLLTVLGTIIVMLNKTREGSVKELTALLKLEQERSKKLERRNTALEKELQNFRDQASQLIFERQSRKSKTAPRSKKKPSSKR